MSKEQALTDYLKKCADPTYVSKVLGGGIIFKKAQSKESWKKRIYYVKDDKKLLYFFYGGKDKPPLGMLDVTSALLAMGPADNINKSGANKAEAVSISISLASEPADSSTKFFVFETTSEAKKFSLMLAYTSRNSNVLVFAQMMDWPDLEAACAVVSGSSMRKFSDLDKLTQEAQLQGELTKYEDEIADYEHKQKLFVSIKAQNSKTKTTAESFEVLQANLLLPLVEQRLDFLQKQRQEATEKHLQVRAFVAGAQTAKDQLLQQQGATKAGRPSFVPPPPDRKKPASDSSPSTSSTSSSEQRQAEQDEEGGSGTGGDGGSEGGGKALRAKSFRRLMSVSRSLSLRRASSSSFGSGDESPGPAPLPLSSPATHTPPPPLRAATAPPSATSTPQTASSSSSSSSSSAQVQSNRRDDLVAATPRHASSSSASSLDYASPVPQMSQLSISALDTSPVAGHVAEEEEGRGRREQVDDATHAFCSECLRSMKSFVPFDMASCDYTEDILVHKNGLTRQLAERVMRKKVLWIIHLTIREIERIPDREVAPGGRFSAKGHNLDLVELAAVYAVLPACFSRAVDPAGAKEAWRRELEDRLLGLLRDQQRDALTADELRHEAYLASMGEPWRQRASLEAKLSHMASLFQVIRLDVAQGESNESTEESFDKLAQLQGQLAALLAHERFKSILAAKKAAAKLRKKMASRHEVV